MRTTAETPEQSETKARTSPPGGFTARTAMVVACVIFFAALLAGPRWWLLLTSPDEGSRVMLSPWGGSNLASDEALYMPTIRRAYDGDLPVSDTYRAGARDDLAQGGSGVQEAIGIFGHLTGGPDVAVVVAATLFAVAAMALLYLLAFEWTGSRFVALSMIPVTLLAVQILNDADGFLPLRHWAVLHPIVTIDPRREFHVWGRFLAPVMVLPAFFGVVYALPKAVERGGRRWMATAALCTAFLVYAYIFYWAPLALALAGWGVWLLVRREFDAARRLAFMGAIAVLLSAPEWIVLARVALSASADVKLRAGVDDPRIAFGAASSVLQRLVVGVPFLYALWRDAERNGADARATRGRLYVALFLAPLILAPIEGFVPQPWHFTTRVWAVFAVPAFIAGGILLFRAAPTAWVRPAGLAVAGVAVLGVGYVAALQVRVTRQVDSAYAVSRDERSAIDWIDANLSEGDTVVTPSMTSNLLLASLTSSSEYLDLCCYTTANDDEIVDRYLRASAAFGVDEQTVFTRFRADAGFPFLDLSGTDRELEARAESYVTYYLLNWEVNHPATLEQRMNRWRSEFEALSAASNPLAPYPAAYLYCGPREKLWPGIVTDRGIYTDVAFAEGESTVLRLVPSGSPGAKPFTGCGR